MHAIRALDFCVGAGQAGFDQLLDLEGVHDWAFIGRRGKSGSGRCKALQ
jgi:hypothetical protein